jgi:hypothetical protein
MKNSMRKVPHTVAMLLSGLSITLGAVVSHAASKADVIASDPCVLVTAADLRAVLSATFQRPNVASDVDSRMCSYENDKFLISVYTGNEELAEFQKDSSEAKKKNDTWGKTIKVSNVSAPYYQNIGEGRLIVWKNKTRFTVGVQDVTFSMGDEALEAAREKLVNIGLLRIN